MCLAGSPVWPKLGVSTSLGIPVNSNMCDTFQPLMLWAGYFLDSLELLTLR